MKFAFIIALIFGTIVGKFIYDDIKRTIKKRKDNRNLVEVLNDISKDIENSTLEQIDENTYAIGNVKIKVTKCNLNDIR